MALGAATTTAIDEERPRHRLLGALAMALLLAVLPIVYLQFRGDLTAFTRLTMISNRAGLVLDVGSKVTYHGVKIGRVASVEQIDVASTPRAKLTLKIDPRYTRLISANVAGSISATTVFGTKYVSLAAPENPVPERISNGSVIEASSVTTEFNTLFETITSLAQKVDPVKLNTTLTATAQALDGLGDRFGQSVVNGDAIVDDLNPQMPQVQTDLQKLTDLADVYSPASPDLWDFLDHATHTAATIHSQQTNLDIALMSAVGFGNTGSDILERTAPYLTRGTGDLIPTAQLLDEYSPAIVCTIRNFHDVEPKYAAVGGGNGYSGQTETELMGAGNPYVYPDNLPRINAHGGPEGRPGCWQPITHDLWPSPYLVMDTGASLAPYNHFGLGQPILNDYVWGRQIGEYTINP